MDTIESCIKKIQTYLGSDSFHQPFFVNVNNAADLQKLKDEIPAGMVRRSVADFCQSEDENPSPDAMLNALAKSPENILLLDLIPALEMYGESLLNRVLSSLSTLAIQRKVVVLCYQAMRYFNDFNDPRFARRFIQLGGKPGVKPNVVLISSELSSSAMQPCVIGIQGLLRNFEKTSQERIFVVSKKHKSDYPGALLYISELSNAYDILAEIDSNIISVLEKKLGTAEQWKELLKRYSVSKTWQGVIEAEFGTNTTLSYLVKSWNLWDTFQRWFFFILLKINANKETGYLFSAAAATEMQDDLVRAIYRDILSMPYNDPNFWNVYGQRKILLNDIGNPDGEVIDFCLYVDSMGQNSIFYLTDNTRQEQEKIISCLAKYSYPDNNLRSVLEHIYPDLAAYLSPFQFENPLFDKYFQQYKVQKLTNKITPEFEAIVNQQAVSRDYNRLLPSRSSVTEKLGSTGTCAYWIDAFGVEYLGLVMDFCQKLGMMANVTVCRANLPTITSLNKDFIDEFQDLSTIKDLDEIKHQGKENYDYEKTKLPIHLIREIEIVKEVLQKAFQKLKSGMFSKAVILSDHGASRLAVIKEHTIDIEVDAKGTHGGRCCAYVNTLPAIETATIEDGYCILAGYDRFKGGRKASVETHGGATLEEVVVPVIELTLRDSNIEVHFITQTITVSFRKKARLQLFSKTRLANVVLCVNGIMYSGQLDDNIWTFEMPDLKRPGKYFADIYANKNLIVSQLPFCIEKESARENDLL